MIITHNISAINTNRIMYQVQESNTKSIEKLASGFRINRAADDAAGLSISETMRNQIRGLNQAVQNAEDGISLIQTTDGALSTIQSIIKRCRELAVKAATDTNSSEDRQSMQDEINEISKEVEDITGNTRFNSQDVFDHNNIVLDVNGQTLTPNGQLLSSTQSYHARKANEYIYLQVGANGGENMMLNKYSLTRNTLFLDAIDVSDHAKANASIDTLDTALNMVTEVRAYYGAMQNRLDDTINHLQNYSENLSSTESNIRDTNMAQEAMKLAKDRILMRSSQAMLAQANQSPRNVLALLRS